MIDNVNVSTTSNKLAPFDSCRHAIPVQTQREMKYVPLATYGEG